MIIVIGMDNTGKTTLTEELSEELEIGLKVSPGPIMAEVQRDWVLTEVAENKDMIYDRFPIFEEVVYGNTLRDTSNFVYGDSYYTLLRKANPLIIYARPPKEKIFNFGTREQMKGVVEESEKLLAAYDELAFKLMADHWKVVVYNFEANDVDEMVMACKLNKMMELMKGEI